MGRRVRKEVLSWDDGASDWAATETTDLKFVYDGWNVVQVLDGTTTGNPVIQQYTWGLDISGTRQGAGGIGGLLATVETQGTAGTEDDDAYWYLYDANGNVGQVIDASDKSIAARYEYDPYGNTIVAEGPHAAENPFRFSTKWRDAETGLYYYGYRYYDHGFGRWTNRDPIEELDGANLLCFAGNSPTDTIDRTGLDKWHLRPLMMHSYVFVHQVELYEVRAMNAPRRPGPAVTVGMTVRTDGRPPCGKLYRLDEDKVARDLHMWSGLAFLPKSMPPQHLWSSFVFTEGKYVKRRMPYVYYSYDLLPMESNFFRGGHPVKGILTGAMGLVAVPGVVTREEWGYLPPWSTLHTLRQDARADWELFVRLEDQKGDPPYFSLLAMNCWKWVMHFAGPWP